MFRKTWWLMLPLLSMIILLVTVRKDNQLEAQENRLNTPARVLATFPHDPRDFCQGIVIEGETVYEGTGRYGNSLLKRYTLNSNQPELQVALHPNYFGEGIAIFGRSLYQLTWKERLCIVYDKETLQAVGQFAYTGEGWGLTADDKYLYMSDGTSVIQVLDPANFKSVRKIRVANGRKQQANLNELEFVGKELWACIWGEDRIARIDPKNGIIKGYFDCKDIYPLAQRASRENVLNGIAYDPKAKRLFITGKLWPKIYEVAVPAGVDGSR
jgi:glutaminyl-peptide cyclotransferase